MTEKKADVISFIDKRLEKLKRDYLSDDADLKKRIDALVSSERAMERLMEDLNMNEQNRERIRELRRKIKYEDE